MSDFWEFREFFTKLFCFFFVQEILQVAYFIFSTANQLNSQPSKLKLTEDNPICEYDNRQLHRKKVVQIEYFCKDENLNRSIYIYWIYWKLDIFKPYWFTYLILLFERIIIAEYTKSKFLANLCKFNFQSQNSFDKASFTNHWVH